VANSFTKFSINISLTKKGLSNYEHVMNRVFCFLNKIKSKPINRIFHEEIKQINKIKFDFKNKEDPTSYVSHLAHNFTVYPAENILSGDYLISSFNENLISKYLNGLSANNLNIYLVSKSIKESECSYTEQWYDTKFEKFKFEKYSNSNKQNIYDLFSNPSEEMISHSLDYPPQNKFIPNNFDILEKTNLLPKYPFKVSNSEMERYNISKHSTIWYKQDDTFLLPKAFLCLQIYLDKSILSFREYETVCSIWNSILDNELKEITYMASEANISFKLNFNLEGIYLQVSGFNSSIKSVIYEVLSKFKELITTRIENLNEKLNTQIEDYKKSYRNFYYSAAYSQALAYLEILLRNPSASPNSKLEFLENVNIQSESNIFGYFIKNFLNY
jgi:insulysin